MRTLPVTHLVLDAHGVFFNNPFKPFLATVAAMTGQDAKEVQRRWTEQLRQHTWTGRITDEQLWAELTGSQGDTECWQALLETHYRPGPLAASLRRWAGVVPIWVMSNHRTVWLHRRIARFGLSHTFDRVFVSEQYGLLKPDSRFFAHVAAELPDRSTALFIDDQAHNVAQAMRLGFQGLCVDHPRIDREVDQRIASACSAVPCVGDEPGEGRTHRD